MMKRAADTGAPLAHTRPGGMAVARAWQCVPPAWHESKNWPSGLSNMEVPIRSIFEPVVSSHAANRAGVTGRPLARLACGPTHQGLPAGGR